MCFAAVWASFLVFDVHSILLHFLPDVALLCYSHHCSKAKEQGMYVWYSPDFSFYNAWFPGITMPTLRRVTGNSKGGRVSKATPAQKVYVFFSSSFWWQTEKSSEFSTSPNWLPRDRSLQCKYWVLNTNTVMYLWKKILFLINKSLKWYILFGSNKDC